MVNKKSCNKTKDNSARRSSIKKNSQRQSTVDYCADGNNSKREIFPIVKKLDCNLQLPGYGAVLTRTSEDGVGMEDLDQLQQDFEKLLSTAARRRTLLKSEIECLDQDEEKRKCKKYKQQLPLKYKNMDEKIKPKEERNDHVVIKPNHNCQVNKVVADSSLNREGPRVILPRNDIFENFWSSVEPFCGPVTKDDLSFLDELIRESSQEVNVNIPDLGNHYAADWDDQLLKRGRGRGISKKTKKQVKINISTVNHSKKNGLNAMVDTFTAPLSQQFVASLLEEKQSPGFCVSTSNHIRNRPCLRKRLKKEIKEEVLDDDAHMDSSKSDWVLSEIQKCMAELKTVQSRNFKELKALKFSAEQDLRRQKVRDSLQEVDEKVIEMYKAMKTAKEGQSSRSDDGTCNSSSGSRASDIIDDEEVNKVIQQQIFLEEKLSELSNCGFSLGAERVKSLNIAIKKTNFGTSH
ncbi:hypothetical protein FQA39_LY15232 [Lamprigera yunnana]|nr:hypothetical protein FQA39_LY15232 [Lamprigera yunnana]